MKKIVFGWFIFLILACNESSEFKAQYLVKKYLDSSLDKPQSYQSISFSKLSLAKEEYIQTEEAQPIVNEFNNSYKNFKVEFDSLELYSRVALATPQLHGTDLFTKKAWKQINSLEKRAISDSAKLKSLAYLLVNKSKQYDGPVVGWSITHIYSHLNKFNKTVIDTTEFLINKETNSIIKKLNFIENVNKKSFVIGKNNLVQ